MLALTTLTVSGCSGPTAPPPIPPVTVGVIVAAPAPQAIEIELSGRTAASLVAEVRPQVGGVITERRFAEGSTVSAGQVLYQIAPGRYAAAVEQARGALAAAEAVVEADRTKAERYAHLTGAGGISAQDAADALAASNAAKAQVAIARATLHGAEVDLGFTAVKAPISGRIGATAVTQGALVTASQTTALATIQRLDPMWVNVTQSANDFLALKRALTAGRLGQPAKDTVRIVLADGSEYPQPGRIDFTDLAVAADTGAVTWRITVPNPHGDLLPGLFVKARLPSGVAGNAVRVPLDALSRTPRGAATVLVVNAADVVESRDVTADSTSGNDWLVTQGLSKGDRIVVKGLMRARPGAAVRVLPAAQVP